MNIFVKKTVDEAAARFHDAATDLRSWYSITKQARWRNFIDLRLHFPSADNIGGIVVFNIRNNRYRLLASVKYERDVRGRHINGSVFIGGVMTHAQYDRWCKLSSTAKQEALWPR